MSSPEHREIIEQPSLNNYALGGVETVEIVVNKGRLPRAPRTLSRRERKELKSQVLAGLEPAAMIETNGSQPEVENPMTCGEEIELDYGGDIDGMLFTFNPAR